MPARILTDVTLVAVTSVAIPATARAIALSQQALTFGEVLFLSNQRPPPDTPAIWREIPAIGSRHEYSRFMLHELAMHVRTRYALCVQWDGYVVNPTAWDPAFLDYDYIGAPWPHFADGMRVGNGGFSLRSQRLIEACKTLPIADEAEDVAICRTHRAMLEARFGMRFAPENVARRFAYERIAPTGHEFGLHGAFNLMDHMPRRDCFALFAGLEPGLLNHREHKEILYTALQRGDVRLARVIWNRMHSPDARRR
jgi:hypothetical protein